MTNHPLDLDAYAERRNIDVDWIPMRRATSLSVPLGDRYAIALDPWKLGSLAQETVCLAHELGHCETGSFYNQYAALDVRQRHENRADKWAIQHLIPRRDISHDVLLEKKERVFPVDDGVPRGVRFCPFRVARPFTHRNSGIGILPANRFSAGFRLGWIADVDHLHRVHGLLPSFLSTSDCQLLVVV